MVVVMAPDATQADMDGIVDLVRGAGGEAFITRGVSRTIVGLVGDVEQFGTLNLRSMPGVSDVMRISVPYKLVSREHHPNRSVVQVGGVPIGPDTLTMIAGPCAVEIAGAGADRGPDGQGRRGVAAARRRLQAAHVPVRLPGAGRGRAEDPGRGPRGDRAAGGDRGDRPARRGPGLQLRRHAPGRHPQHAELRAAPGGRLGGQAGAAQARVQRHDRGMADGRGVHRPARQPRHRAVRAGHPHVREGHPQHAGHQRGPGRAAAVPPAGHRRPVALRRPP